MLTLTRLIAAFLLMGFAIWAAAPYDALYDPERNLQGLSRLLGTMGFCVGWAFLGGASKAAWRSAYLGLQAVALTGILAAVVTAIRDIFAMGFRRRFAEPLDAVLAIPEITFEYISVTFEPWFIGTLAGGGVVIGLLVHVIDRLLDRRRLAR